jgi:hypothetical protein
VHVRRIFNLVRSGLSIRATAAKICHHSSRKGARAGVGRGLLGATQSAPIPRSRPGCGQPLRYETSASIDQPRCFTFEHPAPPAPLLQRQPPL